MDYINYYITLSYQWMVLRLQLYLYSTANRSKPREVRWGVGRYMYDGCRRGEGEVMVSA